MLFKNLVYSTGIQGLQIILQNMDGLGLGTFLRGMKTPIADKLKVHNTSL